MQRVEKSLRARALSNPNLAPHLKFVDMGGHGYSVVRAMDEWMETEFVCILRPVERSRRVDGGPILYRVRYRAKNWCGPERPEIEGQVIEGDPRFSI